MGLRGCARPDGARKADRAGAETDLGHGYESRVPAGSDSLTPECGARVPQAPNGRAPWVGACAPGPVEGIVPTLPTPGLSAS
jgi:hypothetical protein